jgi:hypothetical protein
MPNVTLTPPLPVRIQPDLRLSEALFASLRVSLRPSLRSAFISLQLSLLSCFQSFVYYAPLQLHVGDLTMKTSSLIPVERIEKAIYLIRGEKVMLDRDLADLYKVETRVLNQAVGRNRDRFPSDFMFVMTRKEINGISQIVTSSNLKFSKRVTAFTEQGVAMLSSVLHSKRAVQVNIEIMRAFVRLRRMLASNSELSGRLDDLESKYDHQFKVVFDAIRQLMSPPKRGRKQIGFR